MREETAESVHERAQAFIATDADIGQPLSEPGPHALGLGAIESQVQPCRSIIFLPAKTEGLGGPRGVRRECHVPAPRILHRANPLDHALVPPSTVRLVPVMKPASGPAMNATIAAMSFTDRNASTPCLPASGGQRSDPTRD
jgi:hypothetical protein